MSEEIEEETYFESVPVQVIFNNIRDRNQLPVMLEPLQITRSNLNDIVNKAIAAYPENIKKGNYCIISRNSDSIETFTLREHFVPQGLGFGWTQLPRGCGTCDRINLEFGKYEQEWLWYGLMGILRPWYEGRGKHGSPEFHAPNKDDATCSILRLPNGSLGIFVWQGKSQIYNAEGGPGELRIANLQVSQDNATKVSLALHKMTYLVLWLAYPEIVLDPVFDRLIDFFKTPEEKTFMPFWELFIPSSTPGVNFTFFLDLIEIPDSHKEDPMMPRLQTVRALVKAHHVLYRMDLTGTSRQIVPPWDETHTRSWQPLNEALVRIPTEVSFSCEGGQQVSADPYKSQIRQLIEEKKLVIKEEKSN